MDGHISRRAFVGSVAIAPVSRALVPAGGAGLALLSTPARAIEPTTVIMAAQIGMSLWRMSRGGGPGLASLLRQQTEMLRAISQQLSIIDERIQKLYALVEDLKALVAQVPGETVRELYTKTLSGAFGRASEILEVSARHREKYGIEYAIAKVKDEADGQVLNTIRTSRSVLFNDDSLAVLPLVCAAWYTEFEMMVSAVPYEPERIRASALAYKKYLDRWAPRIDAVIRDLELEAQTALQNTAAYSKWADFTCFTGIKDVSRAWSGGGGQNGPFFHERIAVERTLWSISSQDAPVAAGTALAEGFADLREAGISIPGSIDQLATRRWTPVERADGKNWGHFVEADTTRQHAERIAFLNASKAAACAPERTSPAAFARDQNAVTDAAAIRVYKALTYYSMKLCYRDALQSLDGTLKTIV